MCSRRQSLKTPDEGQTQNTYSSCCVNNSLCRWCLRSRRCVHTPAIRATTAQHRQYNSTVVRGQTQRGHSYVHNFRERCNHEPRSGVRYAFHCRYPPFWVRGQTTDSGVCVVHHPHLSSTLTPNKHGRAWRGRAKRASNTNAVHADRTLTSPGELHCCTVGKPGRQASRYTCLQVSPTHPAMRAGFTEQLNTFLCRNTTIDVSIPMFVGWIHQMNCTAGKINSAGPCVTR